MIGTSAPIAFAATSHAASAKAFYGKTLGLRLIDDDQFALVSERYPFMEQEELGIWLAPSGTKVSWFKDPDGNLLSISQSSPSPPRRRR